MNALARFIEKYNKRGFAVGEPDIKTDSILFRYNEERWMFPTLEVIGVCESDGTHFIAEPKKLRKLAKGNSAMTDHEMIELCAHKLGLPNVQVHINTVTYTNGDSRWPKVYDPLNDDGQALRLVKKFHMNVSAHQDDIGGYDYCVTCGPHQVFVAHDLNRAIVECAVKVFSDTKEAA